MDNASFRVTGNARLKGDLHPQGAKNEALQLSAVLPTDQDATIHNVPDIERQQVDDLLSGRLVPRQEVMYSMPDVDLITLHLTNTSRTPQGSVMLLGPLQPDLMSILPAEVTRSAEDWIPTLMASGTRRRL
jgi:UDP-N-acetylglucosamine 1-carboxyvinyltransferase